MSDTHYHTYHIVKAHDVSRDCIVCGIDNEFGLHGQFLETDEGILLGIFEPLNEHQSYPNRLHGGMSSAIIDEMIGRSIQIPEPETWGVTIDLSTKYRKPVPLDQKILARSKLVRNTSRAMDGIAQIVLEDGTVAVEGKARYVKLPLSVIAEGTTEHDCMKPDVRDFPSTFDFPEKTEF